MKVLIGKSAKHAEDAIKILSNEHDKDKRAMHSRMLNEYNLCTCPVCELRGDDYG